MPVPVPTLSNATLIAKVREQFLEKDYAANPLLYDDRDVERIQGPDDWFVQRFISSDDVSAAVTAMAACLRWRKAININDLSVNDFPCEFYKSGGMIVAGVDKEGNRLVILRVKVSGKLNSQFDDLAQKYIAYVLNIVDLETRGRGFAVVFDCSGAGLSNVNMEILRFVISSLTTFFPGNASYVMIYELPWILNSVWAAIKSMLPKEHRERVLCVSKKDIFTRVDPSQWPDVIGGKWSFRWIRRAPKLAPTAIQIASKMGYSNYDLKKVEEFFNRILAVPY